MTHTPLLTVTTLRQLAALSWAAYQQRALLLSHMTLQQVARRTLLFAEGTQSDSLSWLVSGVVKRSLRSQGEEDVFSKLGQSGRVLWERVSTKSLLLANSRDRENAQKLVFPTAVSSGLKPLFATRREACISRNEFATTIQIQYFRHF